MKEVTEKSEDVKKYLTITAKSKKTNCYESELQDLKEYVDLISFNLKRVYLHTKNRTLKDFRKNKSILRKQSNEKDSFNSLDQYFE